MFQHDCKPRSFDVKGMFIGLYVDNGQPLLVMLEGEYFLPICSTPEKFQEVITVAGVRNTVKIQIITDHAEFLASVDGKVRLMLDPWLTKEGATRFTELRAFP